jgi:Flp pilus assembly protein TadG
MTVMLGSLRRRRNPRAGGERGSVAVEFALLAPLFLLLLFGIVDFGHALYMKQIVSNASREAARYASKFHADPATGAQIKPSALTPSVSAWTISKYAGLLPSDANLAATPGGPGYTSGTAGDDIQVTVTAIKTWFVLGKLVPSLGSQKNLSATTVMKCE